MMTNQFNIRPITDKEFQDYKDLAFKWVGIVLRKEKKSLVENRFSKRLRTLKINTYGEYLKHVNNDLSLSGREKQTLIDLLTTNETYFFRGSFQYEHLADSIIPEIANKKKSFRVWSAASSTGEEAYSAAFVLASKLNHDNWEIIGTDINEEVLAKARKGVYPIKRAEKVPSGVLKKYCLKGVDEDEGKFIISDKIKKHVKFMHLNLQEPFPNSLGNFDLIFLRNVIIYFNKETTSQIINRLIERMNRNGHLFMGSAENLNGQEATLNRVAATIYQKL